MCGDNVNSDNDIYSEAKDLLTNYEQVEYLELLALKQQSSGIDDPVNASNAIVELWKMKGYDLLELLWWKQENRTIRTIILALFYTQLKSTTSNFPSFNFYLHRFKPEEMKEREEELKIVLANKKKLAEFVEKALVR